MQRIRRWPSSSTVCYSACLWVASLLFVSVQKPLWNPVEGFTTTSSSVTEVGYRSLAMAAARRVPFLITRPTACGRRFAVVDSPLSSTRNDDRDDVDYPVFDNDDAAPSAAKFAGRRQDNMEVRRTKKAESPPSRNRKDSYYEDDDEYDGEDVREYGDMRRTNRPRDELTRYRYDGGYDDEYDDDGFGGEEEDEEQTAGNFWSNPTGGMDPPPPRRDVAETRRVEAPRRRRDNDFDEEDGSNFGRRRPRPRPRRPGARRSPVPTDQPKVPRVIRDFYDKLFWFGFDVDDSNEVGDKTLFGGTKGKFNGLAYLKAAQASSPSREETSSRNPPRGLPPARNRRAYDDKEYDYRDEEDGNFFTSEGDDYDVDNDSGKFHIPLSRKRTNSFTPPIDSPRPKVADFNRRRGESSQRMSRRGRHGDELADNGSWVPQQISSLFAPGERDRFLDEEEDDDDSRRDRGRDSTSRRYRRRQQRRGSASSRWSPLTILDSFLGIDREEMEYKAGIYDSKMGVGSKRAGSRRQQLQPQRRSAREDPGRPGYAYRYDVDDGEDDSASVVDINPYSVYDIDASETRRRPPSTAEDGGRARSSRVKEQTWEERAMAVERVPPADVIAWGPTGELPMTARMKAIVDALQDIETARRKLDSRIKRETQARDDITILKVDAERQRLKLEESRRRSALDVERLRQIEMDIDDAARELRKARTLVELARDELEEFQERHRVVLSFYNPDQASILVGEALNEFSEFFEGSAPGNVSMEQSEADAKDMNARKATDVPPGAPSDASTSTNSS